ncbi:MAG TPA: fumarylacetoacetate hydrolase family protein [Burkholderiales bacterium]|nr:fumarylacetoacetate hydrolase family protein [Burkholderiales bacterium]
MKLVTFRVAGRGAPRAGVLVDDGACVLDLQSAHRARYDRSARSLGSVLAIVAGGGDALALARSLAETKRRPKSALLPIDAVKLDAPIPRPPQMRDFLCFEKHLVQAFQAARQLRARSAPDPAAALAEMEAKGILAVPQTWYERPIFYHPNRFSVCGHEDDVPWPAYCQVLDFELEFGCYIGRAGKDISSERARDYIFGYTIFNDFSARDEQTKEMPGQLGPGKGKDFDNANAMGPCLVTADEVPDPYNLEMTVRVNGAEWGRGNSRSMRWKFEDCIAHVARAETLHPGEFLGSGTVGDGCGLEHLRFLQPGDVVELEVEGIGCLRNRVVRP